MILAMMGMTSTGMVALPSVPFKNTGSAALIHQQGPLPAHSQLRLSHPSLWKVSPNYQSPTKYK